jgi:exonuclease III
VVLAGTVRGLSARKQSLGNQGETTREQLGLSDHCPVVAEIEIQQVR